MYKIFRYLCFLFFVVLTVLYFFPQHNIPHLNEFYQKITDFYYEIPSHFSQEESIENTLHRDVELLLLEPNSNIRNFFNNLSTDSALDWAIDRDFDDLEYLVSEYFLYNEFFENITLFYNDRVVYKYAQTTSSSSIVITNDRPVRRGYIHLEFAFKKEILLKQLDRLEDLIIVSYGSGVIYSKNKKVPQDVLDFIDNPNEKTRSIIYETTLHQQLKTPMQVYLVKQKTMGIGRILQILYLALLPLLWIVLAVIDKKLIHVIATNKEKQQHEDFLSNMVQQTAEEEDLNWLDDFVSGEELTKREVENDDKQ